jgi:hypothetical protein
MLTAGERSAAPFSSDPISRPRAMKGARRATFAETIAICKEIQEIRFRAWGMSYSQRMLTQESTLAEWNVKGARLKRSNLFSQDLLLPEGWNR